MGNYEPKIVAFVCNWCSYAGADKAGMLKLNYSTDVKLIRMMCSGRVDPQWNRWKKSENRLDSSW